MKKPRRRAETIAKEALPQAKATKDYASFKNPVLLGLVVNDKTRAVEYWECEG